MLDKNVIIGIGGLAQSGKDTLFAEISEKMCPLQIKRFAFADALRHELDSTIQKLYGIDIFKASPEEKGFLRPFLVFHGELKRKSNKDYWLEKAKESLKGESSVNCCTDVRYENEAEWIKSSPQNLLIYIEKFELDKSLISTGDKKFATPPNEVEAKHNPFVRDLADYIIEWEYEERLSYGDIKERICKAAKDVIDNELRKN